MKVLALLQRSFQGALWPSELSDRQQQIHEKEQRQAAPALVQAQTSMSGQIPELPEGLSSSQVASLLAEALRQ